MATDGVEIKRVKVLAVDDDVSVLKFYTASLREKFEVMTAENPGKALAVFEGERPPVCLVDMDMDGVEDAGIHFIKSAQNIAPATQFIIISTLYDRHFVALQTLHGIASLPKPVDPRQLKLAIQFSVRRYKDALWIEKARQIFPKLKALIETLD